MSFSQFLLILRARYKTVVATFFIVVITATVITFLLPKNYKATATVIVNYKGADPVTGFALPAQLMPGYMATQVDIISSKSVAKRVISGLRLTESDAVKQSFIDDAQGEGDINEWLSDLLLKKLDVKPSRESSVIEISFTGVNPNFSAVIANAFSEAYLEKTIELKVEPSKKAAQYFTEQVNDIRKTLTDSQKKLSDYQQQKGIISIDERLDVERARLNDLSSQLVLAQSQAMEAQSRQRNSSGDNAYNSPDITSNPLVQGLKTEIARAESKFADISKKVDRNHPMYQGAQAEIEKLKSELNNQIQLTSGSVATNSRILQQREAEIRSSLERQRAKVLALNQDRDELAVLTREVENAQHSYDMITQRFTQTNIEGQSNQSDVSILNPAVPPLEPSSPKVVLNIIASIFLGGFFGIAFGLISEMLDRRIRSPEELVTILNAPVLGVIPKGKTKLRLFGQAVLGNSVKN